MTRFPDRLALPFTFDPALLARDLANLSSRHWVRHYVRQNYDGDWSVLPLRAPAGAQHPLKRIYSDPTCLSFEDLPTLKASPYFRQVVDTFKCPLRTVRLMRLTSGSVIKEHTDHELGFEDGMVRFHVPVVTNAGVEFCLNGTRVLMQAGSCWYLRLSDPHSVSNKGAADRVHLVIDGYVNDWVADVLVLSVGNRDGLVTDTGTWQYFN